MKYAYRLVDILVRVYSLKYLIFYFFGSGYAPILTAIPLLTYGLIVAAPLRLFENPYIVIPLGVLFWIVNLLFFVDLGLEEPSAFEWILTDEGGVMFVAICTILPLWLFVRCWYANSETYYKSLKRI